MGINMTLHQEIKTSLSEEWQHYSNFSVPRDYRLYRFMIKQGLEQTDFRFCSIPTQMDITHDLDRRKVYICGIREIAKFEEFVEEFVKRKGIFDFFGSLYGNRWSMLDSQERDKFPIYKCIENVHWVYWLDGELK